MTTIYLCIVIFLLCLAVFDLFVGVSNDAVNFMQSAIGAKVAKFRTILVVASLGVAVGAVMSTGMMDVARHGIMNPSGFSFDEVMVIFLAVMVTDVIVLDMFNTLGMPTSTTVSLVFELLGGTFVLATVKVFADPSLSLADLLNSDKALSVIIAIFVSVAIAFFFGIVVMWLSRIVFTFNYKGHSRYATGVFGGIAFTVLAYFILLKGLGKSPYISDDARQWIDANMQMLIVATFAVSAVVMQILNTLRVNVFKVVVLIGTFALAMSFAGNDLVNFIGVPLAGLDSYNDYMANANGAAPTDFLMTSLSSSAMTPPVYLALAGLVMIIAINTSKKAQNVVKTSVDLARQDEGDEMFGSSRAARSIVRVIQDLGGNLASLVPQRARVWVGKRFNKNEMILEDEGAAFDVVRAAVNLVLASMLISVGSALKLPLSTTYVTFMVAMGSSLADRAWSRESAVFRVTGVLSVIGGWFVTAGAAFTICGIVCLLMFVGGIPVRFGFIALVAYLLIRSNRKYKKKTAESEKEKGMFQLMMRTRDPELVWEMLQKRVSRTQSFVCHFALEQFNTIVEGFAHEKVRNLRRSVRMIKAEQKELKKYRRQEMLVLKRCPQAKALESNTWFHLGYNSNSQLMYALLRMLEPVKEHVENNFNPLPQVCVEEFDTIRNKVNELLKQSEELISTGRFDNYRDVLADADRVKDELSVIRKRHLDRMQRSADNKSLHVSLVYLNVLQETQQFLSAMRHQLRAAKKFAE